jgi:hypothetical protein
MTTGLLWFDDDPRRELEEKVLRAAAHYEHKHGQAPDLCYVHPSALGDNGNGKPKAKRAGHIEIRPGRSVLPHHFWIGIGEEAQEQQAMLAETEPAKSASAPHPSLTRRIAAAEAAKGTMTPAQARQLAIELERD